MRCFGLLLLFYALAAVVCSEGDLSEEVNFPVPPQCHAPQPFVIENRAEADPTVVMLDDAPLVKDLYGHCKDCAHYWDCVNAVFAKNKQAQNPKREQELRDTWLTFLSQEAHLREDCLEKNTKPACLCGSCVGQRFWEEQHKKDVQVYKSKLAEDRSIVFKYCQRTAKLVGGIALTGLSWGTFGLFFPLPFSGVAMGGVLWGVCAGVTLYEAFSCAQEKNRVVWNA